MHKRLRLPRFTHVFERNDICALYSSLSLQLVFLDRTLLHHIQEFSCSQCTLDFLSRFKEEERSRMETILVQLADAKIIVNAEISDSDILTYFQDEFTGKPYISVAYFIMSDSCNLGCEYCFLNDRMRHYQKNGDMTPEVGMQGLTFFERLMRFDPDRFHEKKTIMMYGGEPTINTKGVKSLLEEVKKRKRDGRLPNDISLSMVTNGTLITVELADLLAFHGVNVAVSFDGLEGIENTARRFRDGQSSSQAALRGLELLVNANAKVGLSCTLGPQSLASGQDLLRVIRQLRVSALGFNILLPTANFKVPEKYYEDASRFMLKAHESFRAEGIYEDRVMRKVNAMASGDIYAFDCAAAGGNQIVIAPNGDVGLCHGYLGDRKNFVTNIWDENFDPANNPVFIEWSNRSPLCMRECYDCVALGICGGGCPLHADNESGSIWGLDKRFCVHAKMTLEWLVWDIYDSMPI